MNDIFKRKQQNIDNESSSDDDNKNENDNYKELVLLNTKRRIAHDSTQIIRMNDNCILKINLNEITSFHSKIYTSDILQFGHSVFVMAHKQSYVTKMQDFVILSNFNLNPFIHIIPKELKKKIQN